MLVRRELILFAKILQLWQVVKNLLPSLVGSKPHFEIRSINVLAKWCFGDLQNAGQQFDRQFKVLILFVLPNPLLRIDKDFCQMRFGLGRIQ